MTYPPAFQRAAIAVVAVRAIADLGFDAKDLQTQLLMNSRANLLQMVQKDANAHLEFRKRTSFSKKN